MFGMLIYVIWRERNAIRSKLNLSSVKKYAGNWLFIYTLEAGTCPSGNCCYISQLGTPEAALEMFQSVSDSMYTVSLEHACNRQQLATVLVFQLSLCMRGVGGRHLSWFCNGYYLVSIKFCLPKQKKAKQVQITGGEGGMYQL